LPKAIYEEMRSAYQVRVVASERALREIWNNFSRRSEYFSAIEGNDDMRSGSEGLGPDHDDGHWQSLPDGYRVSRDHRIKLDAIRRRLLLVEKGALNDAVRKRILAEVAVRERLQTIDQQLLGLEDD
jgi:CPA1 family monovalent cation:H+ antiporter